MTSKRKPTCVKGTACGYTCISGKKQCSERIKARNAAELLKATEAVPEAVTDETVKPYEEVKILGQGAYGEAVLTDRGTVVKRIREDSDTDSDDPVADAKREYEMLKVFDQLGIGPEAIGFDKQWGDIEMSLVKGDTFEKEYKYASDEDKETLANSAFQAITRLHKAGYSHNDFHPGNVMFDKDLNVTVIDPGFTGRVGEVANEYGSFKSGFYDIAKMFRSLGSPADKYYDEIIDKLDKSGVMDKYKTMRDASSYEDDQLTAKGNAEKYLHKEYLKLIQWQSPYS